MILSGRYSDELCYFGGSVGKIDLGQGADRVSLRSSIPEIEAKVKEIGDSLLSSKKRHCYFRLLSISPLNWRIWVGPVDEEPTLDWDK